ncbi:MAG: DUF559 domain-containing protein [bacterium]|nr:DUF559 domain-containing protein [bacterium]
MLEYNAKLKTRSQRLRNNSTLSEVLLWNEIKHKKLGYQFLRQKPIGHYIVDFYSPKLKLIIEVDGSSHDSKQEYDRIRDGYLKSIGLKLLKFSDIDVKRNLNFVLETLKARLP